MASLSSGVLSFFILSICNHCKYDLELVEPVAKPPYYAETGLVRRRKDGKCVVTFLYSRLSKETADRLAQMVCDKLNELEGEKA